MIAIIVKNAVTVIVVCSTVRDREVVIERIKKLSGMLIAAAMKVSMMLSWRAAFILCCLFRL